MTEPPSDATRFATRPKQRARENLNATDNLMAKLRKEGIGRAMAALPDQAVASGLMQATMWMQYMADDRTLDPETVRDGFDRAMREHTAAVYNRAVIRAHGLVYP